ncbi:MAG TPA: hypothetical protein VFF73_09095, partial [Planctomycetota bacterium]|nr:hypothetical protein [Planctomycetota bacterium]
TRATRAEARFAYLARKDEVARDARDFRELLERQRARRDQAAKATPISIPGSLALELCLTATEKETFTLAAPAFFRGDTERLLLEAGAGLAELGSAWDASERALEWAHHEAKKAGFLATVPFSRARRLLDLVPDRVDLEGAVASVSTAVDRLQVAPEDARAAVADMWALVQRARTALDAAPRSSVSPVAFEDELASMLDIVADATFAAAVDPVRCLRACQGARDQAAALEAALERSFATQLEIGLVMDEVSRVERSLDPTSPNGQDPRGACERARGSLAEAAAALEQGAPDEAEKELHQARTHLRLAEEMLARGEEAKKAGGSTLEQRRAEAAEARAALEKAREVLVKLEADHAPQATADVRPILDAALGTLPALDAALEDLAREEAPLASPQAHARLLRLDAHVTELDRAGHAVERRRQILDETRNQLRGRADELDRRLKEVDDHAKQEDVALRADTLERVKALRESVARVTGLVRGDQPSPDLLALARDVDAVEGELEEARLQVSRDAFLCRRVLSARKAAEDAIRSADDAIRRGTDRLAARARARRARELVEKVGEKLTKADSDWHVVLEAYSSALRAARGARDLGFQKQREASEGEHARFAASAAIRRAERWDAPLVRADTNEASSVFQRAQSELTSNESAAVDLFEKAAGLADEAVRTALQAVRDRSRAADITLREIAKTHRVAREAMERRRRVLDAKRRAEWIERRFAKAAVEAPKADAPSA